MNRSGIRRRRTRQPLGPTTDDNDILGGEDAASDPRHEDKREPTHEDNHVVSDTRHRLSRGTTATATTTTGRLLAMFTAKNKKQDGGVVSLQGDNSGGRAQQGSTSTLENDIPGSHSSYSSTSIPPDSSKGRHGSSSMSASRMNGADDDAHRFNEASTSPPCRPQKEGTLSTNVDSSLWETSSDDDDDDDDDESLFAERSSEPFADLLTILQQFKKRDRIMKKLLDGKSESYCAMMFSNEMAARQTILQCFHRQQQQQPQESHAFNAFMLRTTPTGKDHTMIHSGSGSGGGEQVNGGEDPPKVSAIQSLKRLMMFELYHSVEGSWFATWYCFGNAALFSLVELTLSNSWRERTSNQRHFMAIIVALLMMRADGYLWDWLSAPSREHVNFDMHNRRVLGYWDANLLASFRKGFLSRIKSLNSIVAFYLLFLSVMDFYYQFFYIWAAWFGDFQRCLQRAIGCADTTLVDVALWKYYICQPVVVPIAPEQSLHPDEPIFPQVVFYSISTMVAAWVMTKSQVGLFAL